MAVRRSLFLDEMKAKKRPPLLRWACLGLLALYYGAYFIAQFGDDRNWIVCTAATGITGTILPPALVGAALLAMRRHWIELASFGVLVVAFLVFSGQLLVRPGQGVDRTGHSMRVMTFNIEHGWHGPERVAAIVRSEDIDAFAFQECGLGSDANTIESLKRLLPEYRFLSDSSRTSATRLPIVSERTIALTQWEMSWSILEQVVLFHGQEVRVLNVHAPSYLPEATFKRPLWSWVERWGELSREQHGLLDREIEEVKKEKELTVLCGDFNMTPVGGRYRKLAEVAIDSFAAVGTGVGWTSPSAMPLRRIDYVWCFPGVVPVECHTVNRDASDHAAVIATLAFPNSSAGR